MITHHMPSSSLIDEKYKEYGMDYYNQWFYSDMDQFIDENKDKIKCWIYGHTHTPSFKTLHNVPCMCNPIGYPNENDKLDFNIGTQIGVNLSTKLENKELNNFNYAIFTKHIGKGSRIVAGAYHGNRMFLGTGNDTGILLGYEMKLNKRWYLMGDWVSGSNNEGVAVLGGMYNLSKRVQLCAGWLLPNENNPKPQGVVLEINILTWDLF
jgi:hypothetical protein